MAVSLRMTPAPQAPEPQQPQQELPKTPIETALELPTHAYLARLAALHDEAAETAYLANLLGRAPWAAGLLGAAALAVAAYCYTSAGAALAVWLALVAIAVGALTRLYARAIEAPFDRATLKVFARNVSAALLYAGAAWGAGMSLALTGTEGLAVSIAFTAVVSALLVGILKARDVSLCFLVPATAMGAFCALMRDGNATTMLGILAGGLVVALTAHLLERLAAPALHPQHG